MLIYEPTPEIYRFKYIPSFARFLLDNWIDEYVADLITLSKAIDLPLLKRIQHLSADELREVTKTAAQAYLGFLTRNEARGQIETSMERWGKDQLDLVGKFDIHAEDITAVNYVRGKALKKYAMKYALPEEQKFELMEEIDKFLFASTTTGLNTFITILKSEIEEESHFTKELIHTSPGIISIFDLERKTEIYVNGNVDEVTGYTAEDVTAMGGSVLISLTHPADLPVLEQHFKELAEDVDGKVGQVEYRLKHKDGIYRWLRTYHVIFKKDENGKPLQLLGSTFEITTERETALALEKRESQLLEAQAMAQIGSFEWDMINDHTTYTPELRNILGWVDSLDRKSWLKNVHPDDVEKVEHGLANAKKTGKYTSHYRYFINGKEKILWAQGIVTFEDSKPVMMRGTVQDVTHLKQIENELVRKTVELERSNESLQQFASIASHDLKEPLRKMSMYTDMVLTLEEGKLSVTSSTNLDKVKRSAMRMQEMIEDILKFSTISKDEKKEKVDLKSVITEVLVILEETVKEKNAIIKTGDLPVISAIPAQMRQLFQNLFSNALKFSRPGVNPEISITHKYLSRHEIDSTEFLEPAATYLQINVRDNGIGFRQEHAEKIFGMFMRLHGRSMYEGSGLGLTICKRIAENHGGIIRAESTPDLGATFMIILPLFDH